jgi:hypothetical protein
MVTVWPKLEELRLSYVEQRGSMVMRWVAPFAVLNTFLLGVITVDIRWAAASLWFVIFYVVYHTRSVFVAWLSMVGVVLCFAMACFWAILVCGVTYFDPFFVRARLALIR